VIPATSKLARAVVLSGAYLAAAQLGSGLSVPNSFATFWPPSGLLLAVLLRSDTRMWPWLVLATCPANLAFDAFHDRSLAVSFCYWTGNALEAVAGAWMLRRTIGDSFTLGRVRHVVALVGLAALGSATISATAGAWTTVAAQGGGSYRFLWKLWWMADVIGVLAVAPAILAWSEPRPPGVGRRARLEWLVFVLFAVIVVGLVLERQYVPWFPPRALAVIVVPVLGWAAWRLGPRGTATGLAIMVSVAIKNHLDGVGMFVANGQVTADSVVMMQAVLSGLIVTFLLITAGVAEWGEIEHALREANQLKREFVSTMSHELRTPLAAVLGYLEMARDPSMDEAQRLAFLDDIERAGHQLLELVEAALDVGRLEAGRDEPRLEPVSLPAFWHDLRTGCATVPRGTDVEFQWSDPAPELTLVTDRRKLTVVLRNLITNALKFTERGWVRVEAEAAESTVVFRVRDTGIGVRPEDHERIFEMYRQADGSDARRFGGTGLGLHIVRRFLEQLGGTVSLQSALGRGSTFTIVLPSLDVRSAVGARSKLSVG
jgi:signal transduction histidine kinase